MTAAAKVQQFFELEPQNSQEKEKHPPKNIKTSPSPAIPRQESPQRVFLSHAETADITYILNHRWSRFSQIFSVSIHAICGFTAETAKTKTKVYQRKRKQPSGCFFLPLGRVGGCFPIVGCTLSQCCKSTNEAPCLFLQCKFTEIIIDCQNTL